MHHREDMILFTGDTTIVPVAEISLTASGDVEIPLPPGVWAVSGVLTRVKTAVVGAGTSTLRVGSTSGGQEVLVDYGYDAGDAVDFVNGDELVDLGTDFTALTGYWKVYPRGQSIYVRVTKVGVVTAGVVTLNIFGGLVG